jgi:hypothetical protein
MIPKKKLIILPKISAKNNLPKLYFKIIFKKTKYKIISQNYSYFSKLISKSIPINYSQKPLPKNLIKINSEQLPKITTPAPKNYFQNQNLKIISLIIFQIIKIIFQNLSNVTFQKKKSKLFPAAAPKLVRKGIQSCFPDGIAPQSYFPALLPQSYFSKLLFQN